MALIELTLRSNSLNTNASVWVCYPEMAGHEKMMGKPYQYQPGVKFQTLWLFHGGGGDASNWPRYTSIERYANEHKLMVICPSAYNSFYADMVHGDAYYTWISQELPQILQWMLPISTKREDNFVAGLSMGGYGSLKLAVNSPERFSHAGSFSGAVDMPGIIRRNHMRDGVIVDPHFVFAFGDLDNLDNTDGDVLWKTKQQVEAGVELPKFYVTCGTEDFTWDFNTHLRDEFQAMGIDLTWDERPGTHNWAYWDAAVQRFIDWLPLKNAPVFEEGK